ncbi:MULTISPECIES: sulfotransferase family protein [Halorhodospira]|uniref:sulfotransferase family protein n=1 Tax=Halorhodospira TaxID=85108 RepID=UPI001EE90012|nr:MULTISPECIES: sulfotransferase family protein [Halorhodospira]MCG5528872.1 sulfotransferase family protein [Halorhodospira halophila]MCG5544258.1 sulfotransferase family protein [Halorhodospira sp. 9628]
MDYLIGRGDLSPPLGTSEYLLPQLPHGLMALESAAGTSFHHTLSDHAVYSFLDLAKKLHRPRSRYRYGKGYGDHLPDFLNAAEDFIEDITIARMPMKLAWQRMFESTSQRAMNQWKKRLGRKRPVQPTHIIAQPDAVVDAAQRMHDRIFRPTENRPVILNQAGSGWNPVHSTKYFHNRKVILVTRDPRDQFSELKQYKKAKDVNEFVRWYRALKERLDAIESPLLKKITFEDFIKNHDQSSNSICEHLQLNPDTPSRYEPEASARNIEKYKRLLKKEEIRIIEQELIY